MSNNRQNNWVGGLLLATGAIIGVASALLIQELRPLKASKVLLQARTYYSNQGEVIGSWIDYDPIPYEVFDSQPLCYVGGITLKTAEGTTQYQIIADAYTGDIIDQFVISSHQ